MAGTSRKTVLVRFGRAVGAVAATLTSLVGLMFNFGFAVGLGIAASVVIGVTNQVLSDSGDRQKQPRSNVWRSIGLGLAAAPVVAGLIMMVGAATWPILLLVLAAGLWCCPRNGRWRHAYPIDPNPDPDKPDPTDRLVDLSNSELGRAWVSSHARLRTARDGTQLDRLCALRRRQLDEMERRDPRGFRRWLGSGAWISGSTAPFLER